LTTQLHSALERKEAELVSKPLLSKVATVNRDGSTHVTPTWFMYEDGKFIITTAQETVKVRNIRRDPRVTLLIDDGYKYVMVKGRAGINSERDVEKESEKLATRYLGIEAARKMLPDILKVKHVVVEVIPEEVSSYNL
jgi:PPOX class probable F420-dependent enzyme